MKENHNTHYGLLHVAVGEMRVALDLQSLRPCQSLLREWGERK